MRKAALTSILLALALMAFGQHRTPQPGSGTPATKSKAKVKPKPTPTPKAKWEQYTPCGVYYKDVVDFVRDIGNGWQLISETDTNRFFYDSDRARCEKGGVLKVWIRAEHIAGEKKGGYALNLYELKCNANQLRAMSINEYDNGEHLLESTEINGSWTDAIPDSAGETILKSACRTP